MVRVLIVDDSAFMRLSLETILTKDPEITVIASASNGEQALVLLKEHDPDVITMDIEMPKMDGLAALKHIMEENPFPVLMISSLTQEGAEATLKAMEMGALDYLPKQSIIPSPTADRTATENELCTKIKALARRKAFMRLMFRHKQKQLDTTKNASSNSHLSTVSGLKEHHAYIPSHRHIPCELVVIGVSTGGPPAVQKILAQLPANFPSPILIAQHMPGTFTGPFAKRLDNLSAIKVVEAEKEQRLQAGTAYICPGGKHIMVTMHHGLLCGVVTEQPTDALYKPSANVLFGSAGEVFGHRTLGIMLTGMGSDGVEGAKILKGKGGYLIAQNEASCVVYGMPKAVVDAHLADEVLDLECIGKAIIAHTSK